MGLWHPDTIDGQVAHQIEACDRCEPDRRPRMLVCDYHEGWIAALDGLTPPPGETWRVTTDPDGTMERVPMKRLVLFAAIDHQGRRTWVDVEQEADRG